MLALTTCTCFGRCVRVLLFMRVYPGNGLEPGLSPLKGGPDRGPFVIDSSLCVKLLRKNVPGAGQGSNQLLGSHRNGLGLGIVLACPPNLLDKVRKVVPHGHKVHPSAPYSTRTTTGHAIRAHSADPRAPQAVAVNNEYND